LSPPLPSSLASVKLANPGSPGKMTVKTEGEPLGYTKLILLLFLAFALQAYFSEITPG